jgi:cell division protein FtsL
MLKRSIFLYLFVFTALILLFQLVNSNKTFIALNQKIERQEKVIEGLNKKIEQLEASAKLDLNAQEGN